MRIGTIRLGDRTSAAVIDGDGVRPLNGIRIGAHDALALIADPLTDKEASTLRQSVPAMPPDSVEWCPPIIRPPKNVWCVGKNYRAHVAEGARAVGSTEVLIPEYPVFFSKPHTTLVGHEGAVQLDRRFTTMLDYEGELAIVIGKPLKGATRRAAMNAVFGYSIFNDVTARDVQQQRTQWLTGKSADTFGPMGPWIVTADEIADPSTLSIETFVNGEPRQQGHTSEMIFDVATLLSDLSRGVSLEPGDIVATGTPSGVAWGMGDPSKFLSAGDVVEVKIAKIGSLRNPVEAVA